MNVNDLGAVLGSPPAHDQGPGLNSGGELRFPGRGGLDQDGCDLRADALSFIPVTDYGGHVLYALRPQTCATAYKVKEVFQVWRGAVGNRPGSL